MNFSPLLVFALTASRFAQSDNANRAKKAKKHVKKTAYETPDGPMQVPALALNSMRGFDELAGPFDERRPVFGDAVAAAVLPPGEFAADQLADRRHRVRQVVAGGAEVSFPQQPVGRSGRHRRHEAAVSINPFCIAFLDHPVADKARPWGAQGDQLM